MHHNFLLPKVDFTLPVNSKVWKKLDEKMTNTPKYKKPPKYVDKYSRQISKLMGEVAETCYKEYDSLLLTYYGTTLLEIRKLFLETAKRKGFTYSLLVLDVFTEFGARAFYKEIGIDDIITDVFEDTVTWSGLIDNVECFAQYKCYLATYCIVHNALLADENWEYARVKEIWLEDVSKTIAGCKNYNHNEYYNIVGTISREVERFKRAGFVDVPT